MTRLLRRFTLVLGMVALTLPVAAVAQSGAPARPPVPPAMGAQGPQMDVTTLLNARRQLDLTPRQVAQLDSIERAVVAERRQMQSRIQSLRDSVRTARGTDGRMPMNRDSAMARMETMRPQMEQMRRRDSTSRAAAQRVLTDAQRQQVREMQAEERGRQRGLREAQRGGRSAMRGAQRGARGGMRGGDVRGPRSGGMRMGPRGPMSPGRLPAPDSIRRPPDSGT